MSQRDLPARLPPGWTVVGSEDGNVHVDISRDAPILLPVTRALEVSAAGQLPTGFDPKALYPGRGHPRAIQIALFAANDCLGSLGIDWSTVMRHVPPDRVSVYAGSAHGSARPRRHRRPVELPLPGHATHLEAGATRPGRDARGLRQRLPARQRRADRPQHGGVRDLPLQPEARDVRHRVRPVAGRAGRRRRSADLPGRDRGTHDDGRAGEGQGPARTGPASRSHRTGPAPRLPAVRRELRIHDRRGRAVRRAAWTMRWRSSSARPSTAR